MSPADAVWLLGETRRNPMTISTLLWLDGPVDVEVLRERVEERVVARHPAFRQRILPPCVPGGLPRWEDTDIDLDQHLSVVDLPPPGAHALLEARCSLERSTPLDPDRPRWRSTVYRGYGGDGTAIHTRLHHSLGDGTSLMRLVLSLCDGQDPVAEPGGDGRSSAGRSVARAQDLLATLSEHRDREGAEPAAVIGAGHGLAIAARWTTRLVLPDRVERNVFHGTPHGTKRMAWDPEGHPLEPVESASDASGATVNDVLLTILTTGLHRYLADRDALVDELQIMLPISLRDPSEPLPARFGNRIGLLPVRLPVGCVDPREQLRRLHAQTVRLKRSPAPVISHALLTASALATSPGTRWLHRANQLRSTGVITNVPGPPGPWHLTGSRVLGTVGWGGLTAELNLTGSFITLDERVFVGFVTDTAAVPEPDELLDAVRGAWNDVLEFLEPRSSGGQ